jgi:ligand-binding sensor domain-containing protein
MRRFRTFFSWIIFTCGFLLANHLYAQHPAWRNYTINDGLPSNDVYASMQDSRGYLWFGGSQGICRFNGYQFTRPTDTSALSTTEALYIVEDSRGRIWFNRMDGSLWTIEKDTVRAWPYNQLALQFFKRPHTQTNFRFAVDKTGVVWLASWGSGFLAVQPDGSQQTFSARDSVALQFSVINKQVLCASENRNEASFKHTIGQTSEVVSLRDGKEVSLGSLPLNITGDRSTNEGLEMWLLPNGQILGHFLQTYYHIQDDRLLWHGQKSGGARDIVMAKDGSIWMAIPSGRDVGLLKFRSIEHFRRNEFENLLPGKPVVQVFWDKEGGCWACTINGGVFYCKNLGLGIFDPSNGLPTAEVKTLTSDGHGSLFAGLRQLDIVEFKDNQGTPTLLSRPPIREMQVLYFDTATQRLWAGNDLCFWDQKSWTFAKWLNSSLSLAQHIPVKRIRSEFSGARWWASSNAGFFSIDPIAGTGKLMQPYAEGYRRTFSVNPDIQGNLWLTTLEGLLLCQDGVYQANPIMHPAMRFQAQLMEFLPAAVGGGMVISLRGGGLLIRDSKDHFTQLTMREGLTADWISELDVSPKGVIYGCSNAGLNIISKKEGGTWQIETLTAKHGLPSNQVNDVELLGDQVWIATNGGLVRFYAKPAPAPMPSPVMEKFIVNSRDMNFSENLQLSHRENNLSLSFFSLHFRSGGDIPYRYRLLGADTGFVYTHTREVNFSNLATGSYTFVVQAQNEDGQWSEPSRWAFTILPPWWATWWFRVLVAAALAAAVYIFYQNRLQSIQQEAAEREKIKELESAALRAQMNPHFIFNCLQAIQSFIAKNDRITATNYLARFAKLVRLALHGSVDGLHTLAEEIAMLENYLYLEQLRFGGIFEFSVRAEAGLDKAVISFPPLLVQPFVENALLHGLQDRADGGLVEVVFAARDSFLEVTVTDNGQGFSEKKTAEKRPHKSVGMMLTQKRLDLLMGSDKPDSEHLVRETVLDGEGNPVGARVRILIPI